VKFTIFLTSYKPLTMLPDVSHLHMMDFMAFTHWYTTFLTKPGHKLMHMKSI